MYKNCVICGKEFKTKPSKSNRKCCSKKCAGVYRKNTYGCLISEETRKRNSEKLKELWKDNTFRESNIKRMKENNPVYMEGVTAKAKETRLKHGGYKNYFKYGNGKISEYEQKVYDLLIDNGFYYNYAIPTKLARDAFPNKNYAKNYKPDFVNLSCHICIEIDGRNHDKQYQKELDSKKEECLKFLGFKIIRFSHKQIDNGELKDWINGYFNK